MGGKEDVGRRALVEVQETDAPVVDASVFGLDGEHSVWCFGVNDLHKESAVSGERRGSGRSAAPT